MTSEGLGKLKTVLTDRITTEINGWLDPPGRESKSLAREQVAQLRRYRDRLQKAGGVEEVLKIFDAAMDPAQESHWMEAIQDLVKIIDGEFIPGEEVK